MAFQFPATYKFSFPTSSNPTFIVDLPTRKNASASKSSNAAKIRYTSKSHRVRIRLPLSPSPSITRWSLDTPEQDEDDDNDPSFVGSKSEHPDDEDRKELSDDEIETRDENGEELSNEDGEESSKDDGEGFDDENPEEKVATLLPEAKKPRAPDPIPHIAAAALTGTVTAGQNDVDRKDTIQTYVTKEGQTAFKRDEPPAISTPTAGRKPPPFAFGNASPLATTSASQSIPSGWTTVNSTAVWNYNTGILPKSLPMSLYNELLFIEVFKIQEIDGKSHRCQGLDAKGAQCMSSVPRCQSLSIKLVGNSLELADRMKDQEIEFLAMYNMCAAHTKQSAGVAKEWIRLAKLTEAARRYWLDQQKSLSAESEVLWNMYAEFAAAEVGRILAHDKIAVQAEKGKTKLGNELQTTTTRSRTNNNNIESEATSAERLNEPSKKSPTEYLDEISALEKQIIILTTENSSLKKARELHEDAVAKEHERDQRDLLCAKDLYSVSQRTVEALHKEISGLTSKVGQLMTESSSLKRSQRAAEDALVEERKRVQQDFEDLKDLYEGSQKTVEALRKDADDLNSYIGELKARESSLKNLLESTQDALTKENMRSRELEIRLEERMALGIKTQDSPETKLEKYLREELDKSQRHALQQQKDFEKLRDDHVRIQIANATLESQVKQFEAVREDLAERDSDLSNQLLRTRAQFEQLKAASVAMEKGNEGEASKSKFSLREIYRRPKHEPSKLPTQPID
jgi:predicted  nucleic acid-binding Zn-ribbon protein